VEAKRSTILRRGFAWFTGIFLAISVLFPVIVVPIYSSWGAENFKKEFDSKQQRVVWVTPDEWSVQFAGCFGLNALERLSHDPNLKPSGRRIATEIRDDILSGRNQYRLVMMLRRGWYVWPISCAIAYVYVVDGLRTGYWATATEGPQ
jgi:hypothetical protein